MPTVRRYHRTAFRHARESTESNPHHLGFPTPKQRPRIGSADRRNVTDNISVGLKTDQGVGIRYAAINFTGAISKRKESDRGDRLWSTLGDGANGPSVTPSAEIEFTNRGTLEYRFAKRAPLALRLGHHR